MKNHYIFKFWNVNDLYSWEILAKVPVNEFEWIKDTSQFTKYFRKILEKLHELHNGLSFLPERIKVRKSRKVCY